MKHTAIFTALAIALPACAGAPPSGVCEAAPLAVRFHATADSNGTASGAGLPTQVRLLQLRRDDAARRVDFETFWGPDDVLEADVVSREQFTMLPGTEQERFLKREPAAQFILAAAWLRAPEDAGWRAFSVLSQGDGPCGTRPEPRKPFLRFHLGPTGLWAPGWLEAPQPTGAEP